MIRCWPWSLIAELRERIRELEELLRRHPDRLRQIAVFGQGKVQFMQNFSVQPGQTGKLNIIFADSNDQQHPLSAVPTFAVTNGNMTATPDGAQTPTDPSYTYDIAIPAGAAVGDVATLHVSGTNPDGKPDEEDYVFTVAAPDDTKQIATFT